MEKKTEPGIWDHLELKLKTDEEEEFHFVGWRAGLMRELVIYRAVMTLEGAHSFVTAKDRFKIGSKTVSKFLLKMRDKGLLKEHKEHMVKKTLKRHARRGRLIVSSVLQPGQFQHAVINHKENLSLTDLLLLRERIDVKIKSLMEVK